MHINFTQSTAWWLLLLSDKGPYKLPKTKHKLSLNSIPKRPGLLTPKGQNSQLPTNDPKKIKVQSTSLFSSNAC